jgi:hypothetical protein
MVEEDAKARVLEKTFGNAFATMSETDVQMAAVSSEGWYATTITVGGVVFGLVYNIQSWDLSGYTLQDMTLFPQGVLFQDMGLGPAMVPLSPERLERVTMVSNWPINEDDLTRLNNLGQWNLPGSPGSTFNLDNIISGRYEAYFTMTNYASNVLVKQKETQFGSGDSTAGERMWLCDAYLFPLALNATVSIPDSAIVMPSIIAKEPELEYMMRLSRSLEPVY